MQSYGDMISFVYSDNGTYFFKRLHQEVEQMQRGHQPIAGGHLIKELNMTLSEALDLAVSAVFAIQDEFLENDHQKDFEAWKKKHQQEEMDYQTWIHKSLIYQLEELKLTDITAMLRDLGADADAGPAASPDEGRPGAKPKKKKKFRFFGKH